MTNRIHLALRHAALLMASLVFAAAVHAQAAGASPETARTAPPAAERMPQALQRALESGNQAGIDAELKNLKISTRPGEPPRHSCGATECTCSGAKGCSTISTACKPETLDCDADTCHCTKK